MKIKNEIYICSNNTSSYKLTDKQKDIGYKIIKVIDGYKIGYREIE